MSIFTDLPTSSWVASNAHAFAVRDGFPVSPGHTLVVTRRAVIDWFSATPEEQRAIFALVDEIKQALDEELHPDGYNVGFNAGAHAGQTVMHLHVHVIPRFRGDMDDPRGGVRHVIPSKGNYAQLAPAPLTTGGRDPFSKHVLPLFDRADDISIVAAFVKETGLQVVESHVHAALARGARVRILTGDYLEITQASALQTLLDWQRSSGSDDEEPWAGTLETRVFEAEARRVSFHPKSYRFEGPTFGTAFVGSSNLSRLAFEHAIEWNLRVDRDRDGHAYERVRGAFDDAWHAARVLDEAWVEAYANRARHAAHAIPPWELDDEHLEPLPAPHLVQQEALAALRKARGDGRKRALVVLATGLGKTALAVYDHQQLRELLGRRPRVLFLAHRRELLRQAAVTYRRMLRETGDHDARVSWFVEEQGDLSGDLVFASVAKLSRFEHVAQLATQRFDYVVVDEVHHASADSYRRILSSIEPTFLLGLTATPDRADAADILGAFDDHIAYRADIARGVAIGRLVPFHYFGLKDDINYEPENIPWRNRRFDPAALARAAETEARMETAWRAWNAHPGTKSLVFCCSISHALFVRDWLRDRGVRVAAVFSGEGSDGREASLEALAAGALDAVCSVDVFNEGVDVPTIDRVVMLRPTESSVVFLQQLGRGLRASDGKRAVTVIDFVGNHRIFLERVRTLLSLASTSASGSVRAFLAQGGVAELPEGCSVDLELEAKELLSRLFQSGGADEVERAYRELRAERGMRPTAGELQRMGFLPSKLRDRHGSWFQFAKAEGDLTPDELATLVVAASFFRDVEITAMTKSFKMVMLEAMLDAGAWTSGATLRDIATRSHAILRRAPELFADVQPGFDALDASNEARWLAYWTSNPVAAWTSAKGGQRAWLKLDGDRVFVDIAVPDALPTTFERMTHELVDYRLAQYRVRHRQATGEGFTCHVTWNQRDPILKLPSRKAATLPEGEVDVRLPDGAVWQFRFAKEFVNVARPAGVQTNKLPDLLRSPEWFGPRAGQRGTSFEVRFSASPDGLWAAPLRAHAASVVELRGVLAYPDLQAAAGHAAESVVATDDATRVRLPIDLDDPNLFAVRVTGTSMDGGKAPIRDGDWAVMLPMRGAAISALDGRVVLAQIPSASDGYSYHLKRLIRRDGRFLLASDNADGPTFDATGDTVAIARMERVVRPEAIAPPVGTAIASEELDGQFGLPELPPTSGRHGGHAFVFIDQKGLLEAPDCVHDSAVRLRPSETAYVLAKAEAGWRYLGVGRQIADGLLRIPDVDFATWRRWGSGRSASRKLPEGAQSRAQQAVDALLRADVKLEGRARILGAAERGGLRIDGGEGGFAERTVSLTDLAWVVVADDDVHAQGGLLDEERVNRVRYLDGTPKGSTRWIDARWAIAAWLLARPMIRAAIATEAKAAKVRRPGGKEIDASFLVERVGDALTVVVESRGGTRGSAAERNTDYNEGLELILRRLGELGMSIIEAVVDSGRTAALDADGRRLALEYPILVKDAGQLRRTMSTAQAKVGRAAGARGGGNQTRRLRLFVAPTGDALDVDGLRRVLIG